MASARGAYTPKSGPLAGHEYSSYFQYQQARAQDLGFKNYHDERTVKASGQYQNFARIKSDEINDETPLSTKQRNELLRQYAAYRNDSTNKKATGPLAKLLIAIGIRDPKASYDVGETPTTKRPRGRR